MEIQRIGSNAPRRLKAFRIEISALVRSLTTGTLLEIIKGIPADGRVITTYVEGDLVVIIVEHPSYPVRLYDRILETEVIEGISYFGPELEVYKKFLNSTLKFSE